MKTIILSTVMLLSMNTYAAYECDITSANTYNAKNLILDNEVTVLQLIKLDEKRGIIYSFREISVFGFPTGNYELDLYLVPDYPILNGLLHKAYKANDERVKFQFKINAPKFNYLKEHYKYDTRIECYLIN